MKGEEGRKGGRREWEERKDRERRREEGDDE